MFEVLFLSLFQFLYGVYEFFKSPMYIHKIICNKANLIKYGKVLGLNLSIFALNYLSLLVIEFVNFYLKDYYLNYPIYLIYYFLAIPIYLIVYIISFDYLNNIISSFKINDKNSNEDIVKIFYLGLVSFVFYINATLIYFIPYIGKFLGLFSFSFSYGYFCLEYACNLKNIDSKDKLTIVENNPYFFTGYGSIYGILCAYLSIPLFQVVFFLLFPLCILNLVNTDIYSLEKNKKSTKSVIFVVPILITNIVLSIVDSYLITKKSN